MSDVIRPSEREEMLCAGATIASHPIATPLSSLRSARAQTQTNYLFPISTDPYITRDAAKVLFPLSVSGSLVNERLEKKRSAAITTFAAETRVPVWHFQSFSLSRSSARSAARRRQFITATQHQQHRQTDEFERCTFLAFY
jgi:hypothetical protein